MTKKYLYMSMLSAALLLGGCKDEFLNQEPYTSLPVGDAIVTTNDLQAAANGMYSSLRSTGAYGRSIPIMGDLMADNVFIAPSNSGRYITQNNFSTTVATVEASDMWSAMYTSILRANTVIFAELPAVAGADQAAVDQLKGEAYAVRALCHFELVKFFAKPYTVDPNAPGIPIVAEFSASNPTQYYTSFKPSRGTVQQVYAQILADLEKAYTLMTVSKSSAFFTKYAAKALQARAYQYMGDFANAKTAALDVVNNSGYKLVTSANFAAYWASGAARTDKVETLYEIGLDGVNNNGTNALAYLYDQNGYYDMFATTDLYKTYSATDVRRGLLKVNAAGTKGIGTESYAVNKYPNTSNAADKDDIKVIRYAEVVLILAEAQARTGEPAAALITLNNVASARGAAPYVSLGDQLIEDILTERRKELAFEGHRYWDFMRLNRPIQRTAEHPAAARLIAVDNARRIQPIPQGERDANPNIQQNEGYN
ncbi:RagB/SusD family nutrient uptake outer membrane protein [Rufibacter latericius]|uniref:RagB/SusD family nutrient uptake outer membrane protein n=1 Tax=Rufibacter latericius TaxID=2487040 RepID=A0A3M9MKW9_9BACT|nr:RagB/SusD family nutrient uptake outer membrane protein [Rufibacter latericius]RNI26190.1 RagB/SusD family nutrient uptake outer membrane protein [Rufibacter latericius]